MSKSIAIGLKGLKSIIDKIPEDLSRDELWECFTDLKEILDGMIQHEKFTNNVRKDRMDFLQCIIKQLDENIELTNKGKIMNYAKFRDTLHEDNPTLYGKALNNYCSLRKGCGRRYFT